MEPSAILGPVFATMVLTLLVWTYMYIRRIRFITHNQLPPEDFTTPGRFAELAPAEVTNPADNFRNLFEIPVLFYVLALVLYATRQVDFVYLVAAWVFVAFRVAHSIVHCTINIVMLRFTLYIISSLSVWFIAGRALLGWLFAAD